MLQRSTDPSADPRSMLELELSSEPVRDATEPWLLNQLLRHIHTPLNIFHKFSSIVR